VVAVAPHQGVPGQMPYRNNAALVVALAVKSSNNKIIYQDILIAIAGATNALSMPCREQRTGTATAFLQFIAI